MNPRGCHTRPDRKAASSRGSDARIPVVVALVLPKAAASAAYSRQDGHGLDAHYIFRVLVAELTFDPQPQGSAVPDGERLVIHRVGEQGLRMEGVDKIHALVIRRLIKPIGAMEHHETRVRLQPDLLEKMSELNARPLANGAPAFDAVVTRDLAAPWH